MITFRLNKLVRDTIPVIIAADNQDVVSRKLVGNELKLALLLKLKEEINEAIDSADNQSELIKEIADIEEVLDAVKREYIISNDQVTEAKKSKVAKNGAFNDGIFVETITLDDDSNWIEYYRNKPLQYREVLASDERFDIPTIEKGVYQHYKGTMYEVFGVGYHSESGEYSVVYRRLYERKYSPEIWLRPYAMFIENVTINDTIIPRFKKL